MTIGISGRCLALAAILAGTGAAQCPDPPMPPGGFAVRTIRDQEIIYLDGARTRIDVRFPTAAPGPCGWPVVLLVHGGSGSKENMVGQARYLTQRGYFTAAYDIRGRGSAFNNPKNLGHTLLGEPERLDTVEVVQYLARTYPAVADTGRMAMTGTSQGGQHSWMAAAMSGRTLPPNSRGLTTFPTFKAAYAIAFSPLDEHVVAPEGLAFYQGITQAPTPTKLMQTAFKQEFVARLTALDYAGFAALWTRDPWRQDRAKLATSTVPLMVHMQWNDSIMAADLGVSALETMPATTPTRAFLSALGLHADAKNDRARLQTFYYRWRWFDRFLKGIDNGVERESRFVSAVIPDDLATYRNPATLLWNRHFDQWPPASARTLAWHLRQGGVLDPSPPGGAEPPDTIRHRVDPAASMATMMQTSNSSAPLITSWFPLDTVDYDGPVLTDDIEIAGSPRVVLEVDASGPNFQVHVALYQLRPGQEPRFLQSGVALVRGSGGPQRLDVDVADLHVILAAGDRLRLRVENLTRRFLPGHPPGQFTYSVAPYFDPVDVDVVHTAARPSRLELPVLPEILPALGCPDLELPAAQPADLVLRLEGRSHLAGSPYFLLLGISGMTPGTTLPGGSPILLNVDPVTVGLVPALNGPFLPAGLGTLDPTGLAQPSPGIALSLLPPGLAGLRGIAVGVVDTPTGWRATNPLEWQLY